MRDAGGQWLGGFPADNHLPVGTVRIRTRHGRGGERRAWVKVAEPNSWKLRAQVVWEAANGPLPRGHVVHHKDGDKLNDALDNLEALTKASHLAEHVEVYRDDLVANLVAARRERRWSTKSATKRTGRPPTYTEDALAAALAAIRSGQLTVHAAGKAHGIAPTTLHKKLKQ